MTLLCVPIFVRDIEQARRDMALAAEGGADFVELRIDTFDDLDAVAGLCHDAPVTGVIVTRRPEWEGGESTEADGERLEKLFRAAGDFASYVDVELTVADRVPVLQIREKHERQPRFIVSRHDFQGRPARLTNFVAELNASGADVVKVVWMARSIRDNLEAFEILAHREKPTIALCMGEAGLISRVLAKKFGAFLTFASLRDQSATAPGQVTLHDMKRLYRWDAINPGTRVYGVVASPVMHSMSPAIHNAAFDETGYDGVYLPLLVNPGYESFKAFMESALAFEPLHLSGLSVTLPHKENALQYLTEKGAEVEELARRIGAVNTIIIDRDGGAGVKLRGINTDYAAILDSITARLGIGREQLKDYRVAVIGAGGTGRTAVAALAHYGATVVVYNRTAERAEELAKEFNGKSGKVVAARMEKLCDSCCHIYINTTSVGMYPKVDESPVGEGAPKFSDQTLVFDTIYNPIETRLLREATAAGAKTISGVEMFVRQAVAQFEAWTKLRAPSDVMRGVIIRRLTAPKA